MKIHISLLAALILASTSSMSMAEEAHVHEIKKGETLRQLAEQYLGGAQFAEELQNLNGLPNPLSARPGMLVIIPGAARQAALTKLTAAESALQTATDAAADTYAPDELKLALATYRDAQANIPIGCYEKSRLLAILTASRAAAAKLAADERAVIEEPATLTAVMGTVRISNDGDTWRKAAVNDKLKVRQILATAGNGRCEITLADGSILQVRPASRLSIEAFRRDQRDNVRDSRLRIIMGDVFGKVKKRRNLKSRFKVNSSRTNVAIRGTQLRISGDDAGSTRVSLLSGEINVEAQKKEIKVEPNFGTFVKKNTPPASPIELLPAPKMVRPAKANFTSGWVNNPFEWDAIKHKRFDNYRFELATDPDFNHVIEDKLTGATKVPPTQLVPGTYHWRVASVDENGLEGQPNIGQLTIVRNLGIGFEAESPPYKKANVWVLGEKNTVRLVPTLAESTVETFEYSINGQAFVETPSRMFFKNDGQFAIRARGVAEDGEKGKEVALDIEVDKTPPEIEVAFKPVGNKRRVIITAKDANGIDKILYRVQRSLQRYSDPFLVDRGSQIDVRATDSVGNTSSYKTFAK